MDGNPGQDLVLATGEAAEHPARVGVIPRLTHHLGVADHRGVGRQHDLSRLGPRRRLLSRQPQDVCTGFLAGEQAFVEVDGPFFVAQPEAVEKVGAPRRRRGQDEDQGRRHEPLTGSSRGSS